MPAFGARSRERLASCHPDLQRLFNEVVKGFDCAVIYGHRTVEEQQDLYAQGRTKPGKIVTKLDGVSKRSKHNESPSLAVDVVPYPIDWDDLDAFRDLADHTKRVARDLGIGVVWGGDWSRFRDYPHWEL